ncbi:MAG: radical SAM protein [Finegoldia sp.]|nr:radical SAM protein [Finegoldia sp.]
MTKRNYIIPIFVPHMGCPNDCVFCNQVKITNQKDSVDADKIREDIEDQINNFPRQRPYTQIAFYGGSFTGIDRDVMIKYLSVAKEFIGKGQVNSIRLSTRPDYINRETLNILKAYEVETIELGVQSMKDDILAANLRGHDSESVVIASKLIKDYGFKLGLQMMTGLYKSSYEDDLYTADRLIDLKADFVRIYPTLVIKDTALENLLKAGLYKAKTLEDAIDESMHIYLKFIKAKIPVIRIGLQNTDTIKEGEDVVAGPIHPAFRNLVEDRLYRDVLDYILESRQIESLEIHAKSDILNYFVGSKKSNKIYLMEKYKLSNISYKMADKNYLVIDGCREEIDLEEIFKSL